MWPPNCKEISTFDNALVLLPWCYCSFFLVDMEKDAVLVCTILGFLGSITVTLGFVADSYSSKSVAYDGTKCVYTSPPAVGCGILGLFLVLINQVIVASYTSGWCTCLCRCCCPCWTKRRRAAPASRRRRLGIILNIFSWVLAIVAVIMFITGVSASSREDEPPISTTPTSYACRDPGTTGYFPTASLTSLVAVVLGIASFTLLETAAPETPPHGFFGVEITGTSTGQQSQLQTGPPTGADQEAEHVSLATSV